jgi:hypothetical protein
MPWKETCVMDERIKFIGRILEGEKIASLCRELGISRVTGVTSSAPRSAKGASDMQRAPPKS